MEIEDIEALDILKSVEVDVHEALFKLRDASKTAKSKNYINTLRELTLTTVELHKRVARQMREMEKEAEL